MNPVHEQDFLKSWDGLKLFVRRDIPAKPLALVLLVHGQVEHCGRYDYVTSRLQASGLGVIRFDNRGHGQSEGERVWVNSFQDFVDDCAALVQDCKERWPNLPVFVLGHSMGGFIAAAFSVRYPHLINGQILSGAAVVTLPAFSFLERMDWQAKGRELIPNALGHLVCCDPEVVAAYASDPLIEKHLSLQLAGQVWLEGCVWLAANVRAIQSPSLILHGGGDAVVPKEASEWLYAQISSKDKQLWIYPGLFHEILNEPAKDKVLDDIWEWIAARITV